MTTLDWDLEAESATWFARLDARVKLAWLGAMSLASVLVESRVALACLFGIALVVALSLRFSVRAWLLLGGALAALAWGTVLSQAMFYPAPDGTVFCELIAPRKLGAWLFPGVRLYLEGALFGLQQSLRLLAMTLAGVSVCLSTTPDRLLAALVSIRAPIAVSFMAVTALRFLPTILGEWQVVRRAGRLRGYQPRWLAHPASTLRIELTLIVPVVATALRRATTLASSLSSRGFDATRPRTTYPRQQMSNLDCALLALMIALAVALSNVKTLYWISAAGYVSSAGLAALNQWTARWL